MHARGALGRVGVLVAALAVAAGLSACGDDAADDRADDTTVSAPDATDTATAPDSTSTPPADGPTGTGNGPGWVRPAACTRAQDAPVERQPDFAASSAPFALLTDVSLAAEECGASLTFEFAATPAAGGDLIVPGYVVELASGPFTIDPSGEAVEVEGDQFLSVVLFSASVVDLTADPPAETYSGPPPDVPPGLPVVDVQPTGSFEAVTSYVVGLHGDPGFTVTTTEDPPTLTITFG